MKIKCQPLTIYIPPHQRETIKCDNLMLHFKEQGYAYYIGVAMIDDSYLSIFVHTKNEGNQVIKKMKNDKMVVSIYQEPCPLNEVFMETNFGIN
jgi:hypothetical protein